MERVAIYLDANVIYPWRTFSELRRLALSIVAGQLGQEVVIPSLAADEAEQHLSRALDEAIEQFDRAADKLRDLFGPDQEVYAEPSPWAPAVLRVWRQRLVELGRVVPLGADDAHRALAREVTGTPPARPRTGKGSGGGARDAAIWLTVVRDHLSREEDGHFITADKRDFTSGDGLKLELVRDLEPATHPLHVYDGVDSFVGGLGEPSEPEAIDLAAVKRRSLGSIRQGLRDSVSVASVVFPELDPRLRYRIDVLDADPVEVVRAREYRRDAEGVLLVDAKWSMTADCKLQEAGTATPDRWTAVNLTLRGRTQVYLPRGPERPDDGQFIAAQLSSSQSVFLNDDGSLLIV